MTTDEILDRVLVPRPNGSRALEQVQDFLADALRAVGADVRTLPFEATPHGFELVFTAALLLVLGCVAALARRRSLLALALACAAPALLLLEFEAQRSPLSGLLPAAGRNVVATFAGPAGAPVLVLSAHTDTATHFGDHHLWGRFGLALGPATALLVGLSLLGIRSARRGRALRRGLLALAALATVPFAAMFWFHAAGAWLRAPSPGAVDDGGSVAALVQLGARLAEAPPRKVTVQLVFFAAEEERTLGSRAFVAALRPDAVVVDVNLEGIGASPDLAVVPEDGFALRRYRTPAALVALLDASARSLSGEGLGEQALPPGTLTDARSFLARGYPAVTLVPRADGGFPRGLHSARDDRERLSVAAIDRTVDLLATLVRRVDADPRLLASAGER